jgi:hypothetical protein
LVRNKKGTMAQIRSRPTNHCKLVVPISGTGNRDRRESDPSTHPSIHLIVSSRLKWLVAIELKQSLEMVFLIVFGNPSRETHSSIHTHIFFWSNVFGESYELSPVRSRIHPFMRGQALYQHCRPRAAGLTPVPPMALLRNASMNH